MTQKMITCQCAVTTYPFEVSRRLHIKRPPKGKDEIVSQKIHILVAIFFFYQTFRRILISKYSKNLLLKTIHFKYEEFILQHVRKKSHTYMAYTTYRLFFGFQKRQNRLKKFSRHKPSRRIMESALIL